MSVWGVRLFFLFSVAPLYVPAVANSFDNDFEEKPWTETEVQLPDFPLKENLITFRVGAVTDVQFQLDSKSLSVGADDVIRYTLVVISSSGAENISYEGMRCVTAERRSYAFGRSDKTWSKARGSQWGRIQGTSNNLYVDLYSNFFCTIGVPTLRSAEDVLRVLRRGGNHRH